MHPAQHDRWLALAIATACALGTTLHAAEFDWQGASGNWNDPAHWVGNLPPQSLPTDQLLFNSNSTFTVTPDHNPWIVNGITITGSGTPAINTTNSLGVQFDGNNPFITRIGQTTAGSTATLNLPIILNQTTTYSDPHTFGNFDYHGNETTFTGPISGPGGLVFQSGAAALAVANSFTGGVTINGSSSAILINAGTPAQLTGGTVVDIFDPLSLGTGPVTLSGQGQFATLQLNFGSTTVAFNNDFNIAGATNRILSAQGASTTLTLGALTFAPGDAIVDIGSDDGAGHSRFTFKSTLLQGNATIGAVDFQTAVNCILDLGPISETNGSHSLTFNSRSTFLMNSPSSYSGGTTISNIDATVSANAANAFGTGPVTLNAGLLNLNAASSILGPTNVAGGTLNLFITNAARNTITATALTSTINYSANGAAGGHLITAGSLIFGNTVTSFSNGTASDTFATLPGGTITSAAGPLALFDRATNFNPGFATTVINTSGGLPGGANLGNSGDLLIGLTSSFAGDLTLGPGSPWLGFNNPTFVTYTGTLTVRGAITLQNMALGDGSAGSFAIKPDTGISPVNVTLANVTFNSAIPDFSGINTFLLTGGLTLAASNGLGGGGTSTPRPVQVASTASLGVNVSDAINANVSFSGGQLFVAAPGLTGSGTLSRDALPMNFDLENTAALTGTQFTPAFIHAGDTVILGVSDIVHVSQIDPAANYVMNPNGPGLTIFTQAEGLNVNGGSITFPNFGGGGFGLSSAIGAVNTLHIGVAGETLLTASAGETMLVPIVATGPVTIGNGVDPSFIALTNSNNQFATITLLPGSQLVASNPGALTGATINMNTGSTVHLVKFSSVIIPPVMPPVVYDNTINVLGNSTLIADPKQTGSPFIGTGIQTNRISTVNLAANLTLQLQLAPGSLTLDSVHLIGDGTLTAATPNSPVTISSITEDSTPRRLNLAGPGPFIMSGMVSSTGAIAITQATAIFNGTVANSPQPLTVTAGSGPSASGIFGGIGTIHRAVSVSNSHLDPGNYNALFNFSQVGALTIDSLSLTNSLLEFNLGTPNVIGGSSNDLLIVNGDLSLNGELGVIPGLGFAPGTYRLINYTGSLLHNGFTIDPGTSFDDQNYAIPSGLSYALDFSSQGQVNLIVAQVPEPASLLVTLPLVGLILRRRHRSAPGRG